jgi:hypothetical protein
MRPSAPLLRTDAACLVAASILAFGLEAIGVRVAGIGFVDAHELALIPGVVLWAVSPRPSWQVAAASLHALFAATNLAHWEFFVAADLVTMGYVTTAAHVLFVVVGVVASRGVPVPPALRLDPARGNVRAEAPFFSLTRAA